MIQVGKTDHCDVRRAQLYRLAGRTLRYRVYVAIEVAWNIVAVCTVAWDVFIAPGAAPKWAFALLVALAVAHSMKMMVHQPWQLLKALAVGGLVFTGATVLNRATGWPFGPAAIATVCGSAYYFWLGELWTRREAVARERAFYRSDD